MVSCTIRKPAQVTLSNGDTPQLQRAQVRGLYIPIHSWSYHHADSARKRISTLMKAAHDAFYQVVFFEIVNGGQSIIPESAGWESLNLPEETTAFDPVEWAVRQAHQYDLELYATGDFLTLWANDKLPASGQHIYYTHGPGVAEKDRWLLYGTRRGKLRSHGSFRVT